jgi:hypothetical protein
LTPIKRYKGLVPRGRRVDKGEQVVCTTDESGRRDWIKAKLPIAGISHQERKIPDQADQELAIMASAEGRFFGGTLIACDQSLNHRPSGANGITELDS